MRYFPASAGEYLIVPPKLCASLDGKLVRPARTAPGNTGNRMSVYACQEGRRKRSRIAVPWPAQGRLCHEANATDPHQIPIWQGG